MPDRPSAITYVFINEENVLRSGWRVLIFLIAFILLSYITSVGILALGYLIPPFGKLLAPALPDEGPDFHFFVLEIVPRALSLASALAATWICARFLEKRSLASVGFKRHKGWLRDFALGSLIGALSLTLAVGIAAVAGADKFKGQIGNPAILAKAFTTTLIFFLLAGALEEVLFRGFAFQAFEHNLGAIPAILLTSVPFGLAHLANKNSSFFSTVNIVLAGTWSAVAYLKTRSLWFPTALHYSWNWIMVFVFGLPVSGLTDFGQTGWLHGVASAPGWLSGADFGPEAGAAATVVVILSTLLIWRTSIFSASPEMLASIRHGKTGNNSMSLSETA